MSDDQERPIMVQTLAGVAGFAASSIARALRARGVKMFRFSDHDNAPWFVSAADAEEFVKRVARERELRPSRVDTDLRALKVVWRRASNATRAAFRAFIDEANPAD